MPKSPKLGCVKLGLDFCKIQVPPRNMIKHRYFYEIEKGVDAIAFSTCNIHFLVYH